MVTYQLTDDGRYRLQLYGKHETPGYLALGLSHDKSMVRRPGRAMVELRQRGGVVGVMLWLVWFGVCTTRLPE